MEVRFVAPDLRAIDELSAEVIACGLWRDERPARGLAGLLDWRLAGRLSKLAKTEFVTGVAGEVLCVPGRPRLPFDKVIVVGLGERAAWSEDAYRAAAGAVVRALEGLRVKRAVVELPGRGSDAIAAERAAEIVFEMTRGSDLHDAWWIVEAGEARAKIATRAGEERRRISVHP